MTMGVPSAQTVGLFTGQHVIADVDSRDATAVGTTPNR